MARHPRSVDEAIARFDEIAARYDGRTPAAMGAIRRDRGRTLRSIGRRLGNMGAAIGVLILATIAFGLFVGPIGLTGLFLVSLAILALLVLFSVWPGEPKQMQYREDLPTRQVVQQLDSFLVRRRPALPPAAAGMVDRIHSHLPLLESRLAEVDPLDPLAQDARRLMGRHLPELIERYERVPAAYRLERDGEGMTVDERLVAGLGAASEALDDIGARLTRGDLDAFETQGRFLESRYRDKGEFRGE
jgi:hypothetical protein